MNEEMQMRLEAWFDGEATEAEDREIRALLERDPEAQAWLAGLERTRTALREAHRSTRKEAPEWLEVLARASRADDPGNGRVPFGLKGLGSVAAILLLGMALWLPFRDAGREAAPTAGELMVDTVELVETDLEGATPVVYLDEPSGWTVVWVVEEADSGEI